MHTVHSRLKVLIARAFRAEKLYASMRNSDFGGEAASSTLLGELANEVRAREWQRAHTKLRKVLNEILEGSSAGQLPAEIIRLHAHFKIKTGESSALLSAALSEVSDISRRQEFSALLKLTAELVRYKARTQAYQALTEELAAVLDASGHEADMSDSGPVFVGEGVIEDESFDDIEVAMAVNSNTPPSVDKMRNVIPLRRR